MKDAEAYFTSGNAKMELQNYKGAIVDYDKAIALNPDDAEAYYNRGIAKAKLENYKEAIADYDKAIELKSDYANAYYNRGAAKAKLEYYEGAIADYDQAIELKPDYAYAYNNRGVAKKNLENYEDAIADYDQAIALDPDYAEAYYNRGTAKADRQNDEAAIAGDNNAGLHDFSTAISKMLKRLTFIKKSSYLAKYTNGHSHHIETVAQKKINVVNPCHFNDPLDCQIAAIKSDHQALKKVVSQVYVASVQELANHDGDHDIVVSDSDSMWAYYANDHRGICFVYAIDLTKDFKGGWIDVKYLGAKENHEVDYYSKRFLQSLFATKKHVWKHENEMRYLSLVEDPDRYPDGYGLDEQQLGIRLTRVIFGLYYPKEKRETTIKLIKTARKGEEITFAQINRSKKHVALVVKEISC